MNPIEYQEKRDDLALGKRDKHGNRPKSGGYKRMYEVMQQNKEKLLSGEIDEDDILQMAYDKAERELARRAAGDSIKGTLTEQDLAYRASQEQRYRDLFTWNDANDEAALNALLDLELQQRVITRDLASASLNVKDRTALTSELRNLAKDHTDIQKRLGIDALTRDTKARAEDPMQEFRAQQEAAEAYFNAMVSESSLAAAAANTVEELRALMAHHLAIPRYSAIDPWLLAYDRIQGREPHADLLRLSRVTTSLAGE